MLAPAPVRTQPCLYYYPRAGAEVRCLPLETLPFLIGRGPQAQLEITSNHVSKEHAQIFAAQDSFFIRDLGSTNGTFVNEKRITEARLQNNDVIQVAQEEMRFVAEADAPEAPGDGPHTQPMQAAAPSVLLRTLYLKDMLAQKNVRTLFQPIVELETGVVHGYEALARGTHEHLSMMPIDLLHLAEHGAEGIRQASPFRRVALEEATQLERTGFLFLNVHPAELTKETFFESLELLLAQAPPGWKLVLEIHENSTPDLPAWRRLRTRLQDLGMFIAYDDFGIGQARFLELAEVSPDIIKLDMSLVRDIHLVGARQNLVHALTRASKDLGVQVLAEGVETQEEAKACLEMGCHLAQGYFFGRPQSSAMIKAKCKSSGPKTWPLRQR